MSLADTADLQSLSSRLRAKRDVRLRALISAVHDRKGAVRIIDMGGTPEYWERVGLDFLRASNAHVTITHLHETEIGRAHVRTTCTKAQLVCRILLEKKTN